VVIRGVGLFATNQGLRREKGEKNQGPGRKQVSAIREMGNNLDITYLFDYIISPRESPYDPGNIRDGDILEVRAIYVKS
jgi:hypothetical protein